MTVTPFDSLTITFEVSWTTAWGAAASYVDESAYVRNWQLRRGRSSAFDQFAAGTLTVELDNTTRRFDPVVGASALSPNVVPRKLCRLSATYSAVTYRLFTGYLTSVGQSGEMSNTLGTATLQAADGFNMLSRAKVPTGDAVVGSNESLSARIGRLLDYAGWPAALRDIDTNSPTTIALTEQGQPILEELYKATNSDLGQFYFAGDGDATYHGHAWQLSNNLTPSYVVGDLVSAGEIPYTEPQFAFDDTLIFNRSTATYVAAELGYQQTIDVSDAASKTAYGESVKDLGTIGSNNGNVARNVVEWVVYYYKDPKLRVTQATFNPRRTPTTMFPPMLSAEIGTRWTFKRRPQNVGSAISQDVIVEGISHTMTPATFESTFDLSTAPATATGDSFWRMGSGKWTTGTPSATWA